MNKYFLVLIASLLYISFAPVPLFASTSNEYIMASQPDESYLCAPEWENCFTAGQSQVAIPLGTGSTLGAGNLSSVTIAKDESSEFVNQGWIVQLQCFIDITYTTTCPDWVQPNAWNGFRTYLVSESATTSVDQKYWTAYFDNPAHETNSNGSFPVTFRPEYYYELIINDNGWNIGAYGSQQLGLPYYVLKGVKNKPDPVVIIPGILGSWEKNGAWVLDPILHTYDNLVDTFKANGYIEDQTIFKFPYDWKQPNEITALQLKNKIAEIKTICNCNKVDLVGHSMGGLVAAHYIESSDYQNDVDQLFLVATPLSGAPKAYKAWEGGELDFGGLGQNIFLKTIFRVEALRNLYPSTYSYIRNHPVVSIQELLPVQTDYLKTDDTLLTYPTGYPQNNFLETLVNNFSKITQRGVTLHTIAANTSNEDTVGGFEVIPSTKPGLWEHGQPVSAWHVGGDGTVPRGSISRVAQIEQEFGGTDHTGVASTSSPYVFKKLTGQDPEHIVGTVYGPIRSVLSFYLLSPVDMQITAPDGKKIGKDFSTNTEVNQIPDTFYSGFGAGNEYAIIPNPLPGEYKVETIGTGQGGHYTVVATYADLATSSEVVITGTSTPGETKPYTFIVSPTSTVISLPVATSTPTITQITPDTCITDITKAYKDKWIGKKAVYEKLVFDCKALKGLFKVRDATKNSKALNLIYAGIKLVLVDMDRLAKEKSNTKEGVLLVTKITTWFRTYDLSQ